MLKQGAVFCAAYVPENPQGECGHALPCPRHVRILGADVPIDEHADSGPAHQRCLVPECEHELPCPRHSVTGYTMPQPAAGLAPLDERVPPSLLWPSQPDVELQALAEIVAALQRLDTHAMRARVLRYLNARYSPSTPMDRGPGAPL